MVKHTNATPLLLPLLNKQLFNNLGFYGRKPLEQWRPNWYGLATIKTIGTRQNRSFAGLQIADYEQFIIYPLRPFGRWQNQLSCRLARQASQHFGKYFAYYPGYAPR